jgi:hypothetical protein
MMNGLLGLLFSRRRPPGATPAHFDLAFTAKTTDVDEIAQALEKAKANYNGNDTEAFNKTIDDFVASLKAKHGNERIPVRDAVRLLREFQRTAF